MNKDVVTIVWGDSIAYGIYDYEYGGWVNRLRIKLNNINKSNYVFNLSIPGQNSSDILNRFEEELKNRYNDNDTFKLIFSFGIKDSLLLKNDKMYLKKLFPLLLNIVIIFTLLGL